MSQEMLTRDIVDASTPAPMGRANSPLSRDELAERICGRVGRLYGEDAINETKLLGQDLTAYGRLGTSIRQRKEFLEGVMVKALGGTFFGEKHKQKMKLAVVLYHLSLRCPLLLTLKSHTLARVTVEASGVGIDLKLVCDNAAAVIPERLNALLPLLISGDLGSNKDGNADSGMWRDAVRAVVKDGMEIEEYRASLTEEKEEEEKEEEAEGDSGAVSMADVMAWLKCSPVGEITRMLQNANDLDLLERVGDACKEALKCIPVKPEDTGAK